MLDGPRAARNASTHGQPAERLLAAPGPFSSAINTMGANV